MNYKDGFVGCLRALQVNGKMMDMRGKVERGEVTYGVAADCHAKCDSNPCMNNGICIESYSHYFCDCAYTPYRGWVCGRGKCNYVFIQMRVCGGGKCNYVFIRRMGLW